MHEMNRLVHDRDGHHRRVAGRERRRLRLSVPAALAIAAGLLLPRVVLANTVVEYHIPTPASAPGELITGPSGNHLWFTERLANKIGRIDRSTGAVINEYAVPTPYSEPFGITLGPDGNLWFTEHQAAKVGKVDPNTGAITEYRLPTAGTAAWAISPGPVGDSHVWFTEFGTAYGSTTNKLGQIDPATGVITEYTLPTTSNLNTGIVAGPDGNVWFLESTANQIGSMDPVTGVITEYPVATPSSGLLSITPGFDGNLWFTEQTANQIGSISPASGALSEVPLPQANSGVVEVASGFTHLWVTEQHTNQLEAYDPFAGTFTQTPIPTAGSNPYGITLDPMGSGMWFTEGGANQIGHES